ncbi:chemotaxis protein CheW [Zavarzinia sp. CC-PAN008]|uniref:chemotaxis protein CheW n=1 Tax=Zavarzinia sp. CC-PAN008 TaxID=3243332 RepID=UPI003F747C8F
MADLTQYVTLGVDTDVFAIPVAQVQEILDLRPMSRLPHAPSYVRGLIDVRGTSVPVIDLRARLGLAPAEATAATRILVLQVPAGERVLVLGLIADSVFEVTALDDGRLEPPPEIGSRWRPEIMVGLGRRGAAFVVVLDVARLMAADGSASLAGLGAAA